MPNNYGRNIGAGAGALVGGGAGGAAGAAVGTWIQKQVFGTKPKDAFVMYSYAEKPKYRFSNATGEWIVDGATAGRLYAAASGESADFWTDHGVDEGRSGFKGVVVVDGVAYDANRYGDDARGERGEYRGRTWPDVKIAGSRATNISNITKEVSASVNGQSPIELITKYWYIIAILWFLRK